MCVRAVSSSPGPERPCCEPRVRKGVVTRTQGPATSCRGTCRGDSSRQMSSVLPGEPRARGPHREPRVDKRVSFFPNLLPAHPPPDVTVKAAERRPFDDAFCSLVISFSQPEELNFSNASPSTGTQKVQETAAGRAECHGPSRLAGGRPRPPPAVWTRGEAGGSKAAVASLGSGASDFMPGPTRMISSTIDTLRFKLTVPLRAFIKERASAQVNGVIFSESAELHCACDPRLTLSKREFPFLSF